MSERSVVYKDWGGLPKSPGGTGAEQSPDWLGGRFTSPVTLRRKSGRKMSRRKEREKRAGKRKEEEGSQSKMAPSWPLSTPLT